MRLRERRNRDAHQENLIPLINIVFLILIFFLVASTLRSFDPQGLDLPRAVAEAGADQGPNVLLVFADGGIQLAGAPVAPDLLRERLTLFRRKNPDLPLLIAPDQSLPAQRLVDLSVTARAAGIEDILVVVQKQESDGEALP